jgi:hypothetical protein
MPMSSSVTGPGRVNNVCDAVTVRARGLAKTPAAIRDALDPAQRERFEAEYRAALARAADTLDLEPVLTLVQRTWWVRAVLAINPEIHDGVAADVQRLAAGDQSIIVDGGR